MKKITLRINLGFFENGDLIVSNFRKIEKKKWE